MKFQDNYNMQIENMEDFILMVLVGKNGLLGIPKSKSVV